MPANAPAAAKPSGTHARPVRKPAHDPGSIGAYPGSDDPRVQEWLARFGGKGVRVGSAQPSTYSPQDYADFGSNRMADADGVVTPARPIRRDAATVPTPATPASNESSTPAQPAASAVIPPIAAPSREAAAAPIGSEAPPSAFAPRRVPEPVVETARVATLERNVPGKHSAIRKSASSSRTSATAPSTPKSSALTSALVAVVVLAAVVAIGFSQRQVIRGMFSQAFTVTTSSKVATTVATPPPVPQAPLAPPAQYAIAVGSYPTRDMANAECEYLTRLVPVHVRVNGPGGSKGFRLLLGRFDERDDAESTTKRLQDQGLIPDARVIGISPLPASTTTMMESLGTSAPALLLEPTPTATPARATSPQKPSRPRTGRGR